MLSKAVDFFNGVQELTKFFEDSIVAWVWEDFQQGFLQAFL